MSEFKVGDKVRVTKTAGIDHEIDYVIAKETFNPEVWIVDPGQHYVHAGNMVADTAPVVAESATVVEPKKLPVTVAASDEEDPQFYVLSVEFPTNWAVDEGAQQAKLLGRKSATKKSRYEYLAFGTYEELVHATHAVVTKQDHVDLDDLLVDETLQVVRILDVYPRSQARFTGNLRYVVDFVDGATYVNRNMKDQRAQQLKKDLHARLEQATKMNQLRDAVEKSGDAKAAELYRQLQELEQNG